MAERRNERLSGAKLEITNSVGLSIYGFDSTKNMKDPDRPCRIDGARDLFIIGPNHPLYVFCETWTAVATGVAAQDA